MNTEYNNCANHFFNWMLYPVKCTEIMNVINGNFDSRKGPI